MTQARKAAQESRVGDSRPERKTKERSPKRVPIHSARDCMTITNPEPGRVYRWVNDVQGGHRIYMFQQAGYRHETDPNLIVGVPKTSDTENVGSNIRLFAGTSKDGKTYYSYLMSISQEWYDEDQAAKMAKIDEVEQGMLVEQPGVDYIKKAKIERGYTRRTQ